MNYSNFITLVFLFLLISSCTKEKGELHYFNLYSTTITAVKCESLREVSTLKTIQLSEIEIDKLNELFSTLAPLKEDYGIDARLFGFF